MPTREEVRSLAQDMARSYGDRIRGIAQVKRAEAERKRTEAREIAQRKSNVSTMLKGFDNTHAAMSRELRAKLAGDEQQRRRTTAQEIAQRKSNVGTMLRGFRQEIAQRKSNVGTMLRGFRQEQAGVRDEWRKLTATMQSKRGAPVVEVRPRRPVEGVTEEKAVVRAEVAEVPPEIAVLRDRVFQHLADHPDGTRMAELEQELGVPRFQMNRVIRILMAENKVEKRDLLYFAI